MHYQAPAQAPVQEVKVKNVNTYTDDSLTQNYNDNANRNDNLNNNHNANTNDLFNQQSQEQRNDQYVNVSPHIEENNYDHSYNDNSSKSKSKAEGGNASVVDNSETNNNSSVSNQNAGSVSNSATNLNIHSPVTNQSFQFTPAYTGIGSVSVPGTSIFGTVTGNVRGSYSDDISATVGIQHTFGGKYKKAAYERIQQESLANTLKLCREMDGYTVDYDVFPQLKDCRYVTRKVVVEKTPLNEVKLLKQQVKQQRKLLIQMQNDRKTIIREKFSKVRVGG